MRRISSMGNDYRIETFDLSKEQHDMVVEAIRNDKDGVGNYTFEEVDADMLDSWIDNAKNEGDKEYEDFLSEAQLVDAEVYTLEDWLGEFHQSIGEIAVWDC